MIDWVQKWWKLLIAVALVAVLVIASQLFPVQDWLKALNEWLSEAGPLGWVVYFCVYVLAAVCFVPCSILTIGAGAAYGTLFGVPLVMISAAGGAAASFLVSRYVARGWVVHRFGKGKRFAAVDQAVAKQGGRIVFFLRLSPVMPFSPLSYTLGLTGIGFWNHLIATAAGTFPATILYVYLGHVGRVGLTSLTDEGSGSQKLLYLVAGLLITAALTIYVTRLARDVVKKYASVDAGDRDEVGTAKQSVGA